MIHFDFNMNQKFCWIRLIQNNCNFNYIFIHNLTKTVKNKSLIFISQESAEMTFILLATITKKQKTTSVFGIFWNRSNPPR